MRPVGRYRFCDPCPSMHRCHFCSPPSSRILLETPEVLARWDAHPVSPGHALIIPRRHVATWFEATERERAALAAATELVKAEIEKLHRPDGYNIGINVGEAAGQTVFLEFPRFSRQLEARL
jgi:diadenosine tetraphosphate (Ap4A) HIT family hydrolase